MGLSPSNAHGTGLPLSGGTLSGPLVIDASAGGGNTVPLTVRASYLAQAVDFMRVVNTDALGQAFVGVNSSAALYAIGYDTAHQGNIAVASSAQTNTISVTGDGAVFSQVGFQTAVISSGALPTTTFVSGTGKQVSTLRDVNLVVPVTFNPTAGAAATCAVALSPDNSTYTTLWTETEPAGVAFDGTIHGMNLFVPDGWYVKINVVKATLGTAT